MAKTTTDTHTLNITIILHGTAKILNVVAPSQVESGEEFTIAYDCKNDSPTNDTLWGHIKDPDEVLTGSEWEEEIIAGETKSKSFTHSGITVDTQFVIEVGHN